MSYLLIQMFLYMLVTFLLGLLLGYLIWRRHTHSAGDDSALIAERDKLRADLEACGKRTEQERATAAALRDQNEALQKRLDAAVTMPAAKPVAAAAVAAPVAAPAAAKEEAKPQGLSAPRGGKADDLQEISGVGPKMERLLNDLGYYHFDQIAAWRPSEVAWVDNNLEGFKGRVTRDDWQPQAKD